MNEFEEWKSDNDDPDAPYIPSWERERIAFLAGAAAMKERCAEVAELFDTSYDLTGDELMRRGDAAIRGMEI